MGVGHKFSERWDKIDLKEKQGRHMGWQQEVKADRLVLYLVALDWFLAVRGKKSLDFTSAQNLP